MHQKLDEAIPEEREAGSGAAPQVLAGATAAQTRRMRRRRYGEASANHPNVFTELEAGDR
jgi:hypothetical protein